MPSDRIRHTLDHLVTRNALSYQYFLEALVLTGNIQIANILEPDYSSGEQCRRVIEREMLPQRQHINTNIPIQVSSTTTGPTSTAVAPNGTSNEITTSTSSNQINEENNLQYPVTCSQNHPFYIEPPPWYYYTHANYPNHIPLVALAATSEHRRPPLHPNHHLAMRRQPTYSPMSSSRSNSTTG